MQETPVGSLGQEDPLEEKTATHSRVLTWENPWTEEPGGLQQSHRVGRVRHDWATKQQDTVGQLVSPTLQHDYARMQNITFFIGLPCFLFNFNGIVRNNWKGKSLKHSASGIFKKILKQLFFFFLLGEVGRCKSGELLKRLCWGRANSYRVAGGQRPLWRGKWVGLTRVPCSARTRQVLEGWAFWIGWRPGRMKSSLVRKEIWY